MAGSLDPVMYWTVRTTLCRALRSEADGAAIEHFEVQRTHAEYFQSAEGE